MNKKEAINKELSDYIGFKLFNEDGTLNVSELRREGRKFASCKSTSDVQIMQANTDIVKIDWEGQKLEVYVPKAVQNKIRFYVDFCFSQFDQINDNINSLARDFNITRVAKIRTAQQDIVNSEGVLTQEKKMKLTVSLNGLQDALNELELKIEDTVKMFNSIPKDRIRRTLTVNVKQMLAQEKIAHLSIYEYMVGVGTYVRISGKLGDRQSALACVKRAVDFLQNMLGKGIQHLEGWNEKKDRFWRQKPEEFLELLNEQYSQLLNSQENILICGGNEDVR